MTVLHLGVLDVPYVYNAPASIKRHVARVARVNGKGKDKAPAVHSVAPSGGQSTGDVATILEDKYGIMQFFWDHHADEIAKMVENSLAGALENVLAGNPISDTPFAGGESRIEELFRNALDAREMDGLIEGVPTKAATEGVSHRFKNKKGPAPRPSFIDTGLYQASMRAWVEK